MYFVLFLIGVVMWAVCSGLDDIVRDRKIRSEKQAVRPMGCAKEYKIAYDTFQDYLHRAEVDGWDKVESEIWNSIMEYPSIETDFRRRNLTGEELASQWSHAYARIQVVKMGYTPYQYAPAPHCPKGLPTDDSYMIWNGMWNLNWWNTARYNQYIEFEKMSERLVESMHG